MLNKAMLQFMPHERMRERGTHAYDVSRTRGVYANRSAAFQANCCISVSQLRNGEGSGITGRSVS